MSTNPVTQPDVPARSRVNPKLRFPFLDLQAQFATIKTEVMAAVERVFEDQHFILGADVASFEAEIARLVGCKFAVGCASGSDALLLAMMALGIGEGDEVITSPFTFGATAGSIARLKARPVFVDIDPVTYNINPKLIEAAITPRTRAIMPVHLFGAPAEMATITAIAAEHNLAVIEDAAQAIGSEYCGRPIGSLGTLGCFSFFPSKNLGGAGDGGIVTTNDATLADRLKVLRVHGSRTKYTYELVGMNSRLDALQAAVLKVKLRHLPAWTAARRKNAATYRRMLEDAGVTPWMTLPHTAEGCFHVYNQFVIRTKQRDALRAHLQAAGIPTEIYYPAVLHLQPAYADLGYTSNDFIEAQRATREALALPIYPELTEEQQQAVVHAIAGFFTDNASELIKAEKYD